MVGSLACCARAASGSAAAPPSMVMNSRRFILAPGSRRGIVSVQTRALIGPETGIALERTTSYPDLVSRARHSTKLMRRRPGTPVDE